MMTDKEILNWMVTRRREHVAGILPLYKVKRISRIPDWDWENTRKFCLYWVRVGENLAIENGGKLPPKIWLKKNGYSRLVCAMQRNPDAFAHIQQECLNVWHSDEWWTKLAEQTARSHGGVLPNTNQLSVLGLYGLIGFIARHPELIAHLHQLKRKDILRMRVEEAEKLAATHNGILPTTRWLLTHGRKALYGCMQRHPDAFDHIVKATNYVTKTTDEHVAIAERLVQQHGCLPGGGWLQIHGLSALEFAMRKHPKKFQHLPQRVHNTAGTLVGFRNGTAAQRRALEIKHGLREPVRRQAA